MTIHPSKREREDLARLLEIARQEDLGDGGDVTGSLLPPDVRVTGRFAARGPVVVCGAEMLEIIAGRYDPDIRTAVLVGEGAQVDTGEVLAEWSGEARAILSAERVALNFLQKLCGVATATRQYVDAVEGTSSAIYDTRKTTPGWRSLEKYAVRAGGGRNHRMGLYDAILVKDNHLAVLAADGEEPLDAVRRELQRIVPTLCDNAFVELEVDTLDQLRRALSLPVDIVLLDNMSPRDLRRAVKMRDESSAAGRVELEASGSITLDNVREVALTGVERIAIGALTHSAAAVDIGLDIEIVTQ